MNDLKLRHGVDISAVLPVALLVMGLPDRYSQLVVELTMRPYDDPVDRTKPTTQRRDVTFMSHPLGWRPQASGDRRHRGRP
eukprot:1195058-Prorocentrum_minimum.AAC.1